MSEETWHSIIHATLKAHDVKLVPYVPDNVLRPLIERIHAAPPFEGLSIRLDFAEGNVNEALYYHRYVDGAVTLMR